MFKIGNKTIDNAAIRTSYGTLNYVHKVVDILITVEQGENNVSYFFETCAFQNDLQKLAVNEELVTKRVTDFGYCENAIRDFSHEIYGQVDSDCDVIIKFKKLSEDQFDIIIDIDKINFYYEGILTIDTSKPIIP